MFTKVKAFFERINDPQLFSDISQETLNIATAVLLVEISNADFDLDPQEKVVLEASVARILHLTPEESSELIALAHEKQAHATSLYEHTRLIVDHFTPEQKKALMTAIWQVAFADGKLDPNEEYVLRKIADLIYLPHRDFIQTKLAVVGDH